MLRWCVGVAVAMAVGGCSSPEPVPETPGLAARGTTMTTATPTRQDLTNKVSLAGKVTLDPLVGIVAPAAGQVRYRQVPAATSTPTKPTRVATIWAGAKRHPVDVPAGAVFAGRLVDDRATVAAGTPVASAKHIGYGIVAEIGGEQAYQISESLASVRAQIKGGPGPFPCTVLGTISALPPGVIPPPPAPPTDPAPDPAATPVPGRPFPTAPAPDGPAPNEPAPGSESTGLRLVCRPPANVKMINGAGATLEVITERADDAIVLPVEAVAGRQGKGQVDIVKPDGTRETRDVVLGLTDGRVIQIKSGLTGTETVAVPGPDLAAPPVGQDPGPGGPGKVGFR